MTDPALSGAISPPPAPEGSASQPPNEPPPAPPALVVGRAIDAYLKNCDAFMDENGDRVLASVCNGCVSICLTEFQPNNYDAAVSAYLVVLMDTKVAREHERVRGCLTGQVRD